MQPILISEIRGRTAGRPHRCEAEADSDGREGRLPRIAYLASLQVVVRQNLFIHRSYNRFGVRDFTEPSSGTQQVTKYSIFGTDLLGLAASSNGTCLVD